MSTPHTKIEEAIRFEWEQQFDELWNKVFPARNGLFLQGNSPRFPIKKAEIKKFIESLLQDKNK